MAATSNRPRFEPAESPASDRDQGLVAFVGLGAPASKALERAVPPRWPVKGYASTKALVKALAGESEAERGRSRLFVVNMPTRAREKAWLECVRELNTLVPDRPIIVAVRERNNRLIKQALKVGADAWISSDEATDPDLLRLRLRQIIYTFARDHQSFYDVLRSPVKPGHRVAAHATGQQSLLETITSRVRDSLAHGHTQDQRQRERRTVARRHTDAAAQPPRAAEAAASQTDMSVKQQAEAAMGTSAASAAIERVRASALALAAAPAPAQVLSDLLRVRVPNLRNAKSGRLDAKLIAAALGLSLRQLAGLTRVTQQALSETPDSRNAQSALEPLARVLDALEDVLPAEKCKAWLEEPNPRWDNRSPREVILQGEADAVAHVLEILRDGAHGQ
jgi:DNA-binding NarL/FixJ family response regulator/transcriptional regulator with XRE-family HTH domain